MSSKLQYSDQLRTPERGLVRSGPLVHTPRLVTSRDYRPSGVPQLQSPVGDGIELSKEKLVAVIAEQRGVIEQLSQTIASMQPSILKAKPCPRCEEALAEVGVMRSHVAQVQAIAAGQIREAREAAQKVASDLQTQHAQERAAAEMEIKIELEKLRTHAAILERKVADQTAALERRKESESAQMTEQKARFDDHVVRVRDALLSLASTLRTDAQWLRRKATAAVGDLRATVKTTRETIVGQQRLVEAELGPCLENIAAHLALQHHATLRGVLLLEASVDEAVLAASGAGAGSGASSAGSGAEQKESLLTRQQSLMAGPASPPRLPRAASVLPTSPAGIAASIAGGPAATPGAEDTAAGSASAAPTSVFEALASALDALIRSQRVSADHAQKALAEHVARLRSGGAAAGAFGGEDAPGPLAPSGSGSGSGSAVALMPGTALAPRPSPRVGDSAMPWSWSAASAALSAASAAHAGGGVSRLLVDSMAPLSPGGSAHKRQLSRSLSIAGGAGAGGAAAAATAADAAASQSRALELAVSQPSSASDAGAWFEMLAATGAHGAAVIAHARLAQERANEVHRVLIRLRQGLAAQRALLTGASGTNPVTGTPGLSVLRAGKSSESAAPFSASSAAFTAVDAVDWDSIYPAVQRLGKESGAGSSAAAVVGGGGALLGRSSSGGPLQVADGSAVPRALRAALARIMRTPSLQGVLNDVQARARTVSQGSAKSDKAFEDLAQAADRLATRFAVQRAADLAGSSGGPKPVRGSGKAGGGGVGAGGGASAGAGAEGGDPEGDPRFDAIVARIEFLTSFLAPPLGPHQQGQGQGHAQNGQPVGPGHGTARIPLGVLGKFQTSHPMLMFDSAAAAAGGAADDATATAGEDDEREDTVPRLAMLPTMWSPGRTRATASGASSAASAAAAAGALGLPTSMLALPGGGAPPPFDPSLSTSASGAVPSSLQWDEDAGDTAIAVAAAMRELLGKVVQPAALPQVVEPLLQYKPRYDAGAWRSPITHLAAVAAGTAAPGPEPVSPRMNLNGEKGKRIGGGFVQMPKPAPNAQSGGASPGPASSSSSASTSGAATAPRHSSAPRPLSATAGSAAFGSRTSRSPSPAGAKPARGALTARPGSAKRDH